MPAPTPMRARISSGISSLTYVPVAESQVSALGTFVSEPPPSIGAPLSPSGPGDRLSSSISTTDLPGVLVPTLTASTSTSTFVRSKRCGERASSRPRFESPARPLGPEQLLPPSPKSKRSSSNPSPTSSLFSSSFSASAPVLTFQTAMCALPAVATSTSSFGLTSRSRVGTAFALPRPPAPPAPRLSLQGPDEAFVDAATVPAEDLPRAPRPRPRPRPPRCPSCPTSGGGSRKRTPGATSATSPPYSTISAALCRLRAAPTTADFGTTAAAASGSCLTSSLEDCRRRRAVPLPPPVAGSPTGADPAMAPPMPAAEATAAPPTAARAHPGRGAGFLAALPSSSFADPSPAVSAPMPLATTALGAPPRKNRKQRSGFAEAISPATDAGPAGAPPADGAGVGATVGALLGPLVAA
mmetsp:Transcript_25835/g.85973  ORF Transcript_25835/g.85973 Transcript_25835/m.85973 type:complete len:412 (+) Transcript_25835:2083-3318(+)